MINNEININIRNESEADYRAVEELTRRAFYNLYVPGCAEHYLVHIMRTHKDFVPELDLVILVGGKIIGSIMYTKARLVDDGGQVKNILTFGPLCIAPEYQRLGYGKRLLTYSFEQAVKLGFDTIVIFGDPNNYVSRGFVSCQKYHVCIETGQFPTAMMVKALKPEVFDGRKWIYYESPVMQLDMEAAGRFDDGFESMEKKWLPSQESFYMISNSFLRSDGNIDE